MSERPGVVNLHLAVDMSQESTMMMLYKIGEGYVKEQHYGLALARVVDLPPQVIEMAEKVSKALEAQTAAKKQSSKAFALARRRKLVLGLKETLMQAESGPMEGKVLLSWLRRLQEEFVRRMEQIDNDVLSSEVEEMTDEEDQVSVTKQGGASVAGA
jgi:DNA mismatch repair protein MSH4